MNRTMIRIVCLALCLTMTVGFAGCAAQGEELVRKALESLSENEKIQQWMEENDIATLTEDAVNKFKESIPVLKEFLSREDVQQQFRDVGLPMIREFLNYGLESMRLKAQTLGNIIRIFAPELTAEVEAIFETAPEITETTGIPDNS